VTGCCEYGNELPASKKTRFISEVPEENMGLKIEVIWCVAPSLVVNKQAYRCFREASSLFFKQWQSKNTRARALFQNLGNYLQVDIPR
jgi:hypothetical protein